MHEPFHTFQDGLSAQSTISLNPGNPNKYPTLPILAECEAKKQEILAKLELLGPDEREIFKTICTHVRNFTGVECLEDVGLLTGEDSPFASEVCGTQFNSPLLSNKELICYGQALLSVYRHVKRGLVPDAHIVNYLRSKLSPEAARVTQQEEEVLSRTHSSPHMTRAGLANEVLKDKTSKFSRLAVLPADLASQVNHAVRLESLRELQELLSSKFLKSSLRTSQQIHNNILEQEGLCNLATLCPPYCFEPDAQYGDCKEDVFMKLSVLAATPTKRRQDLDPFGSRFGCARGNFSAPSPFFALSNLRKHGLSSVKQLSNVGKLTEELILTYKAVVDQKRLKRETCREMARQAASRIAAIEMKKMAVVEREKKARMKALREKDMDSYLRLIKQTKNKRIQDILEHTERLLQDIGAKIELERRVYAEEEAKESEKKLAEDAGTAGVKPEAVAETAGAGGETLAEGGGATSDKAVAEPLPPTTTTSAKPQYYTMSHRLRETVQQPNCIVGGKLMAYQVTGLEFLISLYNNNISGILADEMGLGKTIQTIALIAYLKEVKKNNGPHLIAVPLSTLPNWASEFIKWCPSLKVVQYRGNKLERKTLNSEVRRGRYNVLLTTFDYILKEKKVLSTPRWKFIIVDEGHKMKNVKSKFHSTLGDFKSTHRLLLTGTPLQNNLNELWSLLHFLMPQTFSSSEDFERWFEEPFRDQFSENQKEDIALTEEEKLVVIDRLHLVLRPFLLRRIKADVLSDLPCKREYVIRIQLSKWQLLVYEQLVNRCLRVRDSSGKITNRSVANVIMQLRKVVNHPYLFLDEYKLDHNLWRVSGKFELLDRMLPKLLYCDHKVLIFCQMTAVMDILGDFFDYKDYKYHRLDGSMPFEERQERIDDFNQNGSDIHIFMLSTRAGGLGLNLQAADTVILFDSDWNPHADLQAQARAHRVGQKREVRVFRFVTVSPVEELILARAEHKLNIDQQIIQAGMFSNRYNEEERGEKLRHLLSQKDKGEAVRVTTPQELIRYMARDDEEEELFSSMDQEIFGSDIYHQFFEHDDAIDESEGVPSHSLASSEPTDQAVSESASMVGEEVEEEAPSEVVNKTKRLVEAKEANRIEELLIASGRLINKDEIPSDIVLLKHVPKDDDSFFAVSTDLGVRRSRLRNTIEEDPLDFDEEDDRLLGAKVPAANDGDLSDDEDYPDALEEEDESGSQVVGNVASPSPHTPAKTRKSKNGSSSQEGGPGLKLLEASQYSAIPRSSRASRRRNGGNLLLEVPTSQTASAGAKRRRISVGGSGSQKDSATTDGEHKDVGGEQRVISLKESDRDPPSSTERSSERPRRQNSRLGGPSR